MTGSLVSPELVGRESQVGSLVDALTRARAGFPSTVLVRGEAGAGKTRLLQEFLSLARASDATTLFGVCLDVSAGDLPLVPFRTAFRQLVQSRSPGTMAEPFTGSWRDLHVLLPELAADTGLVDRAGPGAPHVFEVVAAVVTEMAREHCVVLAVDDAQWADQSTLQLLRYLTQGGHPLPLLLVVAYRGEELPLDPTRRKAFEELSRSAADVVTVNPLNSEQVAHLVRCLGLELSDRSMRRLQTRCGGLPFLVEELAAAEHEGLTKGIPGRVRDVVRLRLGGMSPQARLVVSFVAVAGRPLPYGVLADAADLSSDVLAEALGEALTAHLLVEDPDDLTYGFRHAVTREIVHRDLRTAVELGLHVRLAQALEADLAMDAYPSRLCEVAYHWSRTDGHDDDAMRAALRAARASTKGNAHPEAARQYDHVIALWPRVENPETVCGADLSTVSTEAAEAEHWAGATAAALRHIERALATASADREGVVARLHERRTLYSWLDTGSLSRGPDLLDQIGAAVTRERMRASDLMQNGQYAESVDVATTAVELARAAASMGDEIRASIILGVGRAMTGHVAEGVDTIDSALRQATLRGSTEEVVAAHSNLAMVLLGDGQSARAAEVALAGLEDALRRGAGASDGAILAGNAAEALTRLGRLDEAERVVHEALERRPPPALATFLALASAEVDVLRGRLSEAAAALHTIAERGLLDDYQFRLQMRAVEAEVQLWDPSAGHPGVLADLRHGLGSHISDPPGGQDVSLAARLLWLGVRADADARSLADINGDDARTRSLVRDARGLRDRAVALTDGELSKGVRRQLDLFLAFIAGEESRLVGEPDPEVWASAASASTGDPYLHSYALWRQGSALRSVHRRREAGVALRHAYDVAHGAGIHLLAEAVTVAGNAVGLRVGDRLPAQVRRERPSRPFDLTPKEIEVLDLLVRGSTNRRIASVLRMREKTASVHVSHILTKLSVSSRGEAVARAYELGLARPPVSTGD